MLTKEQITETLEKNEQLTKGSDYQVSKSGRSTDCKQDALDVLIQEFGEGALREAEKKELFVRLKGQAFYSNESTTIPGA